jgi:S1-C subfamily serine protease
VNEQPLSSSKPIKTKNIVALVVLSLTLATIAGGAAGAGLTYAIFKHPAIVDNFKPFDAYLYSLVADQDNQLQESVTIKEESAIIDAARTVAPAVVSIAGTITVKDSFFYNQSFEEKSAGTGFIIDKSKGLILTNRHVVDTSSVGVAADQASYEVITYAGETIEVKSDDIAIDPANDLAIIHVDFPSDIDVAQVELGDSGALVPGQRVIAIGNALGEFDNTVTTGVVSALGRGIEVGDTYSDTAEFLANVIQTDAAINQGNSGGPLINTSGQVIGINTAVSGQAENIGFAIPIDDAKTAIQSYLENGRIIRPWLGVTYVTVTAELARLWDLPVDQGAAVDSVVADGPADTAGIRSYNQRSGTFEIITKIEDIELTTTTPLPVVVQQFSVGESVAVTIRRLNDQSEWEEVTIDVTLEERQS